MEFLCSGPFLTTAGTLLAYFLYFEKQKRKRLKQKQKQKQNKKNEIISDGWYIFFINFLIILSTDLVFDDQLQAILYMTLCRGEIM